VLIGFQDHANLGMGYLAAVLRERNFLVDLVDFREGPTAIAARVLAADPLIVGFSLIFQYFLPDFVDLGATLRGAGVRAHFTMGGHFPSLCPDEVLEEMPQLDSIALFEGEGTLLELATRLQAGEDWQAVSGLAFRREGALVTTPPRALVHDLDALPHPVRITAPREVLGWRWAPLIASRGCARRCSFCSIHVFYRTAPGKVVRTRRPAKVTEEMCELADQLGVSIFLFLDDDFPLWGKVGRRWVGELVDEMRHAGLVGRAIWKISCRAEYVEPELFAHLRDAGLYLVYMGLESGSDEGLGVLNKGISVENNLRAVQVLKDLGIAFAYGFMLFDPSTTFKSIHENIQFLRQVVGDGSAAAVFCRMLPYGGTPIREQLRAEGRLKGDIMRPDYDFLDPRLEEYHSLLEAAVGGWVHGDGLSHQLDWAWHEVHITGKLSSPLDGMTEFQQELRELTARCNHALFDFVEETAWEFERTGNSRLLDPAPIQRKQELFIAELLRVRNDFVHRNQDTLLAAVEMRDRMKGPIVLPQIF
jgi:anaerobic magnesium-protoporphyrin IX monomethyl ester cyclase